MSSLTAILFLVLLISPSISRAETDTCGDHDGSGSVGASDALRVLRHAVGQDVTLDCPEICAVPFCGDQSCDDGEACDNCATDCGACSGCAGASDQTTLLDSEEQEFLSLLNAYRASNGAGALENCTSMSRATQGHAEDMRDQDYFSTTGKNGSTFLERACDACYELACGSPFEHAEAIGAGFFSGDGMLESFKDSPGIDSLMLDDEFVSVGIGRATGGGTYGTYWVVDFSASTESSCN
jgi:uncharacterized protein YkwD